MKRSKGPVYLDQCEGNDPETHLGDRVLYNCRMFLHRGDEVPINDRQAANLPAHRLRVERGVTLVDHQVELGRRQVIPGIEQALLGMRGGGYCKVRIGPHLAYGDKGLAATSTVYSGRMMNRCVNRTPSEEGHYLRDDTF
ncbi:MAG: FKBP-type peptidyl-prolyl cis-trans isomerase [Nitrospira sp.]